MNRASATRGDEEPLGHACEFPISQDEILQARDERHNPRSSALGTPDMDDGVTEIQVGSLNVARLI